MTKDEWFTCSDPRKMLEMFDKTHFRQAKWARRRLRLFACACARRVLHLNNIPQLNQALEASENYADWQIPMAKIKCVRQAGFLAMTARERTPCPWDGYAERAAFRTTEINPYRAALDVCAEAQWASAWHAQPVSARGVGPEQESAAARERAQQCHLLRDIFWSTTFQPIDIDRRWLTSTVIDLAQAIYDERAYDRMLILADALMDAGCDNDDIIKHCRGDGPHARGCWVVDLILGKS
jgi:hypothetical protein